MTITEAPLIEARGLAKSYGETRAVGGIDLTVHGGEVFGLLGPNGAGKTTTILMLLGLSEPDAGSVEVCGMDPARNPLAVKRQVGYLPDTVGFYETLTGRQNLRYTARLNELPSDLAEERIAHLLADVGLTDVADRPVAGYSRGMRQRLGVADALVKDPLVVILDEPTMGIDPEGVIEMQALITRLARPDGRAVLLTSHMLHQVQQSCDRMAIFVGGKIVAEGTASDLGAGVSDQHAVVEIAVGSPPKRCRPLSPRSRAAPSRPTPSWRTAGGSYSQARKRQTCSGHSSTPASWCVSSGISVPTWTRSIGATSPTKRR